MGQTAVENQRAVDKQNNELTLLLIRPAKKQIFPLSPAALTQANTSRRKLAEKNQDALILYRDGTLRGIEHIEVLGPGGESIAGKVLSWLANSWRIAVRLSEPLLWPLEELKQLLADCINAQGYVFDDEADEASYTQQTAAAILAASSVAEIFDILRLPPLEDCLDVL